VNKYILGIDLGGTKIVALVADKEGKIIKKGKTPTFAEEGPRTVIGRIIDLTKEVLSSSKLGLKELLGIGICSPGPLDTEKGVVFFAPNLPGWKNVPLKDLLEKEFNIPVYVENDANAAVLGEKWLGAGKRKKHIVYLTVSTGIGGGIIVNGEILHGATDSAAEVGHMTILPEGPQCNCGKKGCLEALASGTAIARRANSSSAEEVYKAALKGDKKALGVIEEAARYLGLGIANLVNVLNPEVVVIGGGVSKMGELLFSVVRETVAKEALEVPAKAVKIVPAQLGDEVGALGAVRVVLNRHHLLTPPGCK
jgi:glucokinase